MAAFFGFTLFTSAALLFWVQPMVAKMLLPLLGGSPAVWNTCMAFFQATLLAGYAYAHLLTTRFSFRAQRLIHLSLMLVTFVTLPVGLSSAAYRMAPWDWNPFIWVLCVLLSTVSLPFFVVSSSAPLLQRWFSHARHQTSDDPYHLYAASNLGSITGLIAYPVLIEPSLLLREQTRLWTALYGLLVLLFAGCAFRTWKNQSAAARADAAQKPSSERAPRAASDKIDWQRRLRWMLCAFIPSSLMLGVTTYLTTDIASVPLLWVVPLAIYLLTFVLAFSRSRVAHLSWLTRILPLSAVVLVFVMLAKSDELAWLQMGVHLLFFFCAAMVWHTRLANDRPPSRRLTEFYFCVSTGGVLGGLFNALLAPVCFSSVIEYPLMIAITCLPPFVTRTRIRSEFRLSPRRSLRRSPGQAVRGRVNAELRTEPSRVTKGCQGGEQGTWMPRRVWRGFMWPAGLGLLTAGLAVTVPRLGLDPHLRTMVVFGVPVILCYLLSKHKERQWQFGLALGAVLMGSQFYIGARGHTLHVERNFFGTLRVTLNTPGRFYELYHGTTVHGAQFVAPERQTEPLAYYHRSGPCGQALNAFNSKSGAVHVAVIGLGTGAMACYSQPGQHWTFYEIDPSVIRLAREGRYFTYLQRCTNAPIDFKLGDARLRLREASANQFDLLVCDAFGSDAPPLHLLDREAMELYLSKLSDHGLLLFHISSRYLDFRPVLANLADYFHLQVLANSEDEISDEMIREGKLPSSWVVLARTSGDLAPLSDDPRWHTLPPSPAMRLWTDDYSNILGIFQWE